MKLYTEEQVRTIIGKAQMLNWDDEFLFSEDYLISSLTPITNFINNQQDLNPEYQKIISDNFNDLI